MNLTGEASCIINTNFDGERDCVALYSSMALS